MSLLTIVQDAASQLGLRQPASVIGSTDLTAQILLRFAVQEGKELARHHDWQNLIVQQTYTTTATVAQTGALPADFDRMIYNVEIWNRTDSLRYSGPTQQRFWEQLKAGVTGGVAGWWRIIGNELNIYPAPEAGDTIAFEYITANWCESTGAVGATRWMDDSDTALIPEDLMTLGLVWRFRASRGFPQYAEDMATYEREKEKAVSRDRGLGRIRTDSYGSNWPPMPIFTGIIET